MRFDRTSHAAVAMIIAEGVDDLEVCFIRRAERDGDPWSGQVAFPGGRADATDETAQSVAERETFEEIGLELHRQQLIGALPERTIERQRLKLLSPFVYHTQAGAQKLSMVREPHEVDSVFWVPLQHLFDERAATELDYPIGGVTSRFPGIRFDEYVIWGLTLRILESFADIMQRRLAVRNT